MAEKQLVKVNEVEGFFHDPDWYKPLIIGENLWMSITYILPGVEKTGANKKEAEITELALYMLEGSLEITYGEEKFEITPETAFLILLGSGTPVRVKNSGRKTAIYLGVYSPPPHPELKIKSREQLRKLYVDNNRIVKSPAEMKEIIGRKAA